MFGKRKEHPDIQKAIGRRDKLIRDVEHAVSEVDRLQAELIREYQDAEEHLEEHRWG